MSLSSAYAFPIDHSGVICVTIDGSHTHNFVQVESAKARFRCSRCLLVVDDYGKVTFNPTKEHRA